MENIKVGFINLGCPKNVVDTEYMMGSTLSNKGFVLTNSLKESDFLVINTCAFLEDARREATQTIALAVKNKRKKPEQKIIVVGCFPQYKGTLLRDEFKSVDLFLGVDRLYDLPFYLKKLHQETIKEKRNVETQRKKPDIKENLYFPRLLSTPKHYAYLKISDGCNNKCSFCVIPKIKGKLWSRSPEVLVKEAIELSRMGVKELILVAQDLTSYKYKDFNLKSLISELSKIKELKLIRILYAYPSKISYDLLEEIKSNEKVAKYLDIPFQHFYPDILHLMRRPKEKEQSYELVKKIREKVPGIALRTSLIIGFPYETESIFNFLLNKVEELEFEHLGVFSFSKEEGTPSYKYKNQIDEYIKEERIKKIMKLQKKILLKVNKNKFFGKVVDAIVDKISDTEIIGRTFFDAPEIDNILHLKKDKKKKIKLGDFLKAKIYEVKAYDLYGEIV